MKPRRGAARIILITAFCLSTAVGCMTNRVEYVFVRLDGRPTQGNAELDQQLQTDKTICLGEGQKANLSGTVVETGHMVNDIANDLGRMQSTNTVIVGCMASRGYKYVAVTAE